MEIKTRTLAGTALLSALVVVLDYSMKYSGWKIPFPWLPILKIDFTGIPIVLSFYLFGFVPSIFTSAIAFFAIVARSGDLVGASMKALAELFTVVGMFSASMIIPKFKRGTSFLFGIAFRCVGMFFSTLIILPIGLSPLIAVFNVIQGAVSIFGGYLIYEAVKKRMPSSIQQNSCGDKGQK